MTEDARLPGLAEHEAAVHYGPAMATSERRQIHRSAVNDGARYGDSQIAIRSTPADCQRPTSGPDVWLPLSEPKLTCIDEDRQGAALNTRARRFLDSVRTTAKQASS